VKNVPVKKVSKTRFPKIRLSEFFSGELLIRTLSALVLMGVFGVFILVPPVRPLVLLSLLAGLWGEATLAFIRWRQGRTTGRCSPQTHLWAGWLILAAAWVIAAGAGWAVWQETQHNVLFFSTVLVLIWTYDTGAYVCGRVFKGPLLAPRVSPGKTWSGCVGGFLSVILMCHIIVFWISYHEGILFEWKFFDWLRILFLSITVSLPFCGLVQGGDLAESAAKRFFGLKDSSTLIPGHGGLWDRLDSTLFVFWALWISGLLLTYLNSVGLPRVGY